MLTVTLTKGLPGSGKSTWAKKQVDESPNSIKRINKDDLRSMLDNGNWSQSSEKFIIKVRDLIILEALNNGKHVIVDDTNLSDKHEAHIKELVRGLAVVQIQDFTHVPLDVCIKNDLNRSASVGEKVIKAMHKQFLSKKETYNDSKELPKAILVDIDGTLAKMDGRSPFDWSKVKEDKVNEPIKRIVSLYDGKVIIFSGRDGSCKKETIEWLDENGIKYDAVHMRSPNDNRKDSIIKREMFEQHIRNKYHIEFVLDDRDQVVDMWRDMGLTCLQVDYGDF